MTFVQRTRLLAFGLFGWSAAMFGAAGTADPVIAVGSAVQAGLMAGCFVTALLPGRMARFS